MGSHSRCSPSSRGNKCNEAKLLVANSSLAGECVCGLEVLKAHPHCFINTKIFKFPSEQPLRFYKHENANYQSGRWSYFATLHGT